MSDRTSDIAVVGGGLAGLAAATLLARAGRSVALFEKSQTLGGRAVTHTLGEFRFNIGPHALYRLGEGGTVLRNLGVEFSGHAPNARGGYAVYKGVKHTLPVGFLSLLTTGAMRLPAKLEAARVLGTLPKLDPQPLQRLSVREWLAHAIRHTDLRQILTALFRLSTYAADVERLSAGSAIAQLQLALMGNVMYLDDGWQVLVDGLRRAAAHAGVRLLNATRVTAVEHDGTVRALRLADGSRHPIAAAVIAASPEAASALIDEGNEPTLRRWATDAIPVKAACLDLALSHLPEPRALFALGIDRPWYLSVHSAVAKLGPAGAAVIHIAKYLDSSGSDPKADEHELEGLLDTVQPGWRSLTRERRFLPNMVVSNALVTAAAGGFAGRPGPAVPSVRNLYVAGDWVGNAGMLADASLASARAAADMLLGSAALHAAAAA